MHNYPSPGPHNPDFVGVLCGPGESPYPRPGPSNIGFRVFDTITRQNDTTAYSSGEVVTGAAPVTLKFKGICRYKGEPFYILTALLLSSNAPTSPGSFSLDLFQLDLTPAADNAAFAPTVSELASYIGTINFTAYHKLSAVTMYYPTDLTFIYVIPNVNLDGIYGVLRATSASTPAAYELLTAVLVGNYDILK